MADLPLPSPLFLYGTAWKEEATERLTLLALQHGFRGIDTANQRKHYHEAGVGAAVRTALDQSLVQRDELFLQTKFTHQGGQDHRLPYDPRAPIEKQVEQSFASSLEHLGVDFLDSYVLHGPSQRVGLGPADWSAWRAMEAIRAAGKVHHLGVSNVSLEQLKLLVEQAQTAPRFVQNRCYASRQWDRGVREFCRANDIIYQGFSLLTANRVELNHPQVQQLARKHQRTPAQIIFRFALDIGMLPLTGTTSADHMRADLVVQSFRLEPAEVKAIENIAAG
jgi:diketogulonate reductase-like aldo/keto reductase